MPSQNNCVKSVKDNAYLELSVETIPRLLSLLDRNPFSPTYGCFDRDYWHYRTLADFPSATYQQGSLAMALLYTSDLDGSIYYQNPKVKDYALAAMLFWSKVQRRDGSFDEWYPNEHSYVATAFTTYAVSEAYRLLSALPDETIPEQVLPSLIRAGKWLCTHEDREVLNHTAGAVAALHNIHVLTGDDTFLRGLQRQKEVMLSRQSKEGWFYEYNGADPGYLSLSVDYLAKYFSSSGDQDILESLESAVNFMVRFLHPDGSYGGEYGSRNTRYLMPHGLVILSPLFPSARYLAEKSHQLLTKGRTINPNSSDDRYFAFFFINNFLQAGLKYEPGNKTKSPLPEELEEHFPEAGIVLKKTENYYSVCNYKKNGVFKLFSQKGEEPKLVINNCGYFAELPDGQIVSSQFFPDSSLTQVSVKKTNDNTVISIQTSFTCVNYSLPFTWAMIPFRVFNHTVGSSDAVMDLFNKWVKRKFITKTIKAPFLLNREIMLGNSRVTIRDIVTKTTSGPCKRIDVANGASTTTHVPSSRYFLEEDLLESSFPCREAAERLNRSGMFKFSLEVVFDGPSFQMSGKFIEKNTGEIPQ